MADDFITEASGAKIDLSEFSSFMAEVTESKKSRGYNKLLCGYLVVLSAFEEPPELSGWNICVRK